MLKELTDDMVIANYHQHEIRLLYLRSEVERLTKYPTNEDIVNCLLHPKFIENRQVAVDLLENTIKMIKFEMKERNIS